MDFKGAVYDPHFDQQRLKKQIGRVFMLMIDGEWRTLEEISCEINAPAASVSAQLRNLRKEEFGSYQVRKRPRGDRSHGLFEYQLVPPITISFDENGQGIIA